MDSSAAIRFYAGSRGFTLVEGLAALALLAVGIIGIAALYSEQSPRGDAHWRQEAVELADAIGGRILATREGREGYAGTIGVVCSQNGADPARSGSSGAARGDVASRDGRPGLAADVAAMEAACWEEEVKRRLPSGQGRIRRDLSTIPVSYVISVSWSSPQGAASYVTRVGAPP